MEEYNLSLSPKDIGEMVEIIRVGYLRMHAEPFAQKLGLSEKTILSIEEGNSPHGLLALKKIGTTFPNIQVELNVKLK